MAFDSVFPLYQDWEVSQLGDVCKRGGGNVQTGPFGSQLHASDYVAEGIPSVMPQNIGDNRILDSGIARITEADAQRLSKYRLLEGDIIYSRRGDVERRALVRESEEGWLCGTGCLRIRFGEGVVHPEYAAHYLGHPAVREWIVRHAHGATMPNLNTTILSELPFVLPPWEVQVFIGDAIELYDQKADLNRRINQTLEAMAQAIFKSWFVDFDPVKAKIAAIKQGEDPLRAAMRAISGKTGTELDQMPREHHDQLAATAALFPDEMEESELGEIPMGWSAASFGSLLSHTIGGDWGAEVPDTLNDTRVAIIRGTDIPDLDLAQSNRVPIRYTSQKKLATRRLQVGDIVLEVSGGSKGQPTGRSFHMTANALREFDCPVEPASFCRLLRPISLEVGVLLGLHLSCIYQQGKTWEYQNQSTGIANFQTSHFLAAELVVTPTKLVIDRFYEIVGPILERRHDAQSKKLVELRDSLLPRLISGDLLVTAAEANHVKGSGL
ncbi:restriction endonuclease subunit S [Stenotrophomonas pavanii]|uniref:restriction endonuclease subunit S n=1 Tax=Stenotrophomonas pavanii TaxID=487698 RepID=UPI004041C4F5